MSHNNSGAVNLECMAGALKDKKLQTLEKALVQGKNSEGGISLQHSSVEAK